MKKSENLMVLRKPKFFIQKKNKYTVIVWNIYKAKKKGFYEDFTKLLTDLDLILLQEYSALPMLNNIIQNSDKESVMAMSFANKANVATGVCTISSMRSIKTSSILSTVLEPITKTPKSVLITHYNLKKKLMVINVHAINFVADHKFRTHMNQIEEYIKDYGGSIILAGDFNTWSSKRVSIINDMTGRNNLTQIEFLDDNRRLKLDRVFVRDCNIKNQKILNTYNSSDHKPLYFELIF